MSDLVQAANYDTDKTLSAGYLSNYEKYFAPLRDDDIRLLELGVFHGGSLQLWRDYFKSGTIVGLDINPVQIDDPSGRIRFYQGRQEDTRLLNRIASKTAPTGFDIIIDDCAHIGELSRISFHHLFYNHLKPGGIYVVEDWGTGYWDRWPDGRHYKPSPAREVRLQGMFRRYSAGVARRLHDSSVGQRVPLLRRFLSKLATSPGKRRLRSHDYGMVGFVKQLIDECALDDITMPGWGIGPKQHSAIESMHVFGGQVYIVKRS